MKMRTVPKADGNSIAALNDDEAQLLELIDKIETQHGFIPSHVAEELARVLAVKQERLERLRGKIQSSVRLDVQRYLERWGEEEGNLIMILHEIENQHGYIPREVAMELARAMEIKLARIYEVITFYHYFKLVPPGRRNASVCMGTACYLKGGPEVLAEFERQLGISEGQTTSDREWHLDVVRCIGCCGMSPAAVVDGRNHGKLKSSEVAGILAEALKHDGSEEEEI